MTDKQFKKLRNRLIKLGKKWRYTLGLGQWKIDLIWRREWSGVSPEEPDSLAYVTAMWQYQKGCIVFNMPACSRLSKAQLEFEFLHELSHILVAEMRSNEKDHDHEERVVIHLSNCLKWTWDKATHFRR